MVGVIQLIMSLYYLWFIFIYYFYDYDSWWGICDLLIVDKDDLIYCDFIFGKFDLVIDYWM